MYVHVNKITIINVKFIIIIHLALAKVPWSKNYINVIDNMSTCKIKIRKHKMQQRKIYNYQLCVFRTCYLVVIVTRSRKRHTSTMYILYLLLL